MPPPSCSWVLSKLSIGNCTAPWSRCSFRTQLTEWGSKKSGSFKVLIEQLRNQETYEEGFWGWSQNPLGTLWPWWSHLRFTICCWYLIRGPYLRAKRIASIYSFIQLTHSPTQNTPDTVWGTQEETWVHQCWKSELVIPNVFVSPKRELPSPGGFWWSVETFCVQLDYQLPKGRRADYWLTS